MVAAWVIPLAVCVPLVAIFIVVIYFCCFHEGKSIEWTEDGAEKHQNEPYDDANEEFADEDDDAEVGRGEVVQKKTMFSKKKQEQPDLPARQGSLQGNTAAPGSTTAMKPQSTGWFTGGAPAKSSPRGFGESGSMQNIDSARPSTRKRETHAEKRVRTEAKRKEWAQSQILEDEASADISREPSEDCEEMDRSTRPGTWFGS